MSFADTPVKIVLQSVCFQAPLKHNGTKYIYAVRDSIQESVDIADYFGILMLKLELHLIAQTLLKRFRVNL